MNDTQGYTNLHPTPPDGEKEVDSPPPSFLEDWAEKIIYNSRLLLIVVYLVLVMGMGMYVLAVTAEFFGLHFPWLGADPTARIIDLTDKSMVANLVALIAIGSLSIFVREIDIRRLRSLPRWMKRLTSGLLKVKMSSSLVGISAVHLFRDFTDKDVTFEEWGKHIVIHLVFLISAYYFAKIENLTHPPTTH